MRKIVVVLLAGLLSLAAFAQRPDWSGQSYNVQRAMESIEGGDFAAAKESLLEEISENDKNGYACLLLAMIDSRADNYGEALTSADKAIRNLPKRDRQTRAIAYYKRAGIYYSIGDYDRAVEDFGKVEIDDEKGVLRITGKERVE